MMYQGNFVWSTVVLLEHLIVYIDHAVLFLPKYLVVSVVRMLIHLTNVSRISGNILSIVLQNLNDQTIDT